MSEIISDRYGLLISENGVTRRLDEKEESALKKAFIEPDPKDVEDCSRIQVYAQIKMCCPLIDSEDYHIVKRRYVK